MRFEVMVSELKFGDLEPKRYVKGDFIIPEGGRETSKAVVLTKTKPPALRAAEDVKPVRKVAETRPAPTPDPELTIPAADEQEAPALEVAPRRYQTRRLKSED